MIFTSALGVLIMKHIALYLIFTTSSLLLTGQAFSYGDNSKYDGVFSLQKQTFSIEHQGKVGAQFNVLTAKEKILWTFLSGKFGMA